MVTLPVNDLILADWIPIFVPNVKFCNQIQSLIFRDAYHTSFHNFMLPFFICKRALEILPDSYTTGAHMISKRDFIQLGASNCLALSASRYAFCQKRHASRFTYCGNNHYSHF